MKLFPGRSLRQPSLAPRNTEEGTDSGAAGASTYSIPSPTGWKLRGSAVCGDRRTRQSPSQQQGCEGRGDCRAAHGTPNRLLKKGTVPLETCFMAAEFAMPERDCPLFQQAANRWGGSWPGCGGSARLPRKSVPSQSTAAVRCSFASSTRRGVGRRERAMEWFVSLRRPGPFPA